MVPVVDLTRHLLPLLPQFHDAVERVFRSGHVLLGPELEGFESEFAAFAGRREAVGVSSGAAAIQLALAALGVGPGDEVLVPAFTAVPTAAAVCALGATPVFVDVDADSATVPADGWSGARTDRTRAAVVVHLYGRPADDPLIDVPVVHDAAQAHGAVPPRRGAAATYSFYPTKNLGGIGDGGAVTTDDEELAGRVRTLRVHGMAAQYVHVERSQNFRMSELEAAWLRLALPGLGASNDRRRAIAARYRASAPHLHWQADHPDHVHHLAVFCANDREATRNRLAAAGVGTAVHYPLALGQQPAYRSLARRPCPNAERWAAQCVTVPCFPELTDDEVDLVAAALAGLEP